MIENIIFRLLEIGSHHLHDEFAYFRDRLKDVAANVTVYFESNFKSLLNRYELAIASSLYLMAEFPIFLANRF